MAQTQIFEAPFDYDASVLKTDTGVQLVMLAPFFSPAKLVLDHLPENFFETFLDNCIKMGFLINQNDINLNDLSERDVITVKSVYQGNFIDENYVPVDSPDTAHGLKLELSLNLLNENEPNILIKLSVQENLKVPELYEKICLCTFENSRQIETAMEGATKIERGIDLKNAVLTIPSQEEALLYVASPILRSYVLSLQV